MFGLSASGEKISGATHTSLTHQWQPPEGKVDSNPTPKGVGLDNLPMKHKLTCNVVNVILAWFFKLSFRL